MGGYEKYFGVEATENLHRYMENVEKRAGTITLNSAVISGTVCSQYTPEQMQLAIIEFSDDY